MTQKSCSTCKLSLPLKEFHRASRAKDGLASRCKSCKKLLRSDYENSAESKRKSQVRAKAWAAANPERVKENGRAYYESNKDKILAYKRGWKTRNKGKVNASNSRRRAIKREAITTDFSYEEIYRRDSFTCYLCHSLVTEEGLTVDHIIPLSKGGCHTPYNVATAHSECNRRKWTLLPHELSQPFQKNAIDKLRELEVSVKREHHLAKVKVARVIDGDTFFVEDGPVGYRVRAGDCNAVELHDEKGLDAKEFLVENLEGKWVGLELRRQQWDRYSRRIAVVWFGKGYSRNLADELIALGLAVPDPTTVPATLEGFSPPD